MLLVLLLTLAALGNAQVIVRTVCGPGGPIGQSTANTGGETINAQTGSTYTYQNTDCGKLVTHSNGGAIAGALPQANATTFRRGWFVDIENLGAGTVTITPTTSTIDGAATLTLITNRGVRIVSNGTNYFTQRGGAGINAGTIAITSDVLKGDNAGNAVDAGFAATAPGIVSLFSGCSGVQYLGADGACHAASGGSPGGSNGQWQYDNAGSFGGLTGTSAIPTAGWTIVNGAVFNNFSNSRIGIYIADNASLNWRFITRALPGGTTYTVAWTIQCGASNAAASSQACSVGLGDGTKYQIAEILSAAGAPESLRIQNLTSVTNASTTPFGPTAGLTAQTMSICVTENNTNRTWFHYSNGSWVQDLQVATGNFLTPTTLASGGISVVNNGSFFVEPDLLYLFTSTSAACP